MTNISAKEKGGSRKPQRFSWETLHREVRNTLLFESKHLTAETSAPNEHSSYRSWFSGFPKEVCNKRVYNCVVSMEPFLLKLPLLQTPLVNHDLSSEI